MKESKAKKARLIRASVLFSIILVLSGMTLLASAAPLPPNEFRGDVTLNGEPAPVGTTINAFINGVHKGSIMVGTAGKYGDGLKYLKVGGDDSDDGKTINFEIAGVDAQETAEWRAQEPPRVLYLSAVGAPTGDVTPPTINIVSPSPDQTSATASITVSGSASDNVGVASVEVKLGSGSWEAATGTDSWSKSVTLSLGPNTIHARATDTSTSGLSSPEASVTVYYTTGDTPPNISITSPSPDDTFTTASIAVSGSASDNEGLDRVEVKVGSGDSVIVDVSGTTASWSETVTLIKGPNTIYATAVDTSGNYTETSVTVVYNPPVGTGDTESHSGSTITGGSAPSSGATPTGTDAQPVSGETVTSTTPTPTTTGTAAPAATLAKESDAEPEEKKGLLPGFEAMFAIAGLLAVIYLLRRR